MANPQKENGYVPIANEIIEALAKFRINGESWQVLLVVLRKTYGWNKKDDEISLTQFQQMTGLKRPNVVRSIKWLVSRKILHSIKEDTSYATKYKFNKNFETWKPSIADDTRGVSRKIPKVVSPMIHTKDTIKRQKIPNPEVRVVQEYINSAFEKKYGFPPEVNYAAVGKRLRVLLGKYTVDGLKECIDWFLEQRKAEDHPTPNACLSADTVQRWQFACPEVK